MQTILGLTARLTELLQPLVDQNIIYMDRQNQLQQSNLSEPDVLCNFSINIASEDPTHKPEIESANAQALDRRELKQSIWLLENADNALYRLGDKVYLLERIEF